MGVPWVLCHTCNIGSWSNEMLIECFLHFIRDVLSPDPKRTINYRITPLAKSCHGLMWSISKMLLITWFSNCYWAFRASLKKLCSCHIVAWLAREITQPRLHSAFWTIGPNSPGINIWLMLLSGTPNPRLVLNSADAIAPSESHYRESSRWINTLTSNKYYFTCVLPFKLTKPVRCSLEGLSLG